MSRPVPEDAADLDPLGIQAGSPAWGVPQLQAPPPMSTPVPEDPPDFHPLGIQAARWAQVVLDSGYRPNAIPDDLPRDERVRIAVARFEEAGRRVRGEAPMLFGVPPGEPPGQNLWRSRSFDPHRNPTSQDQPGGTCSSQRRAERPLHPPPQPVPRVRRARAPVQYPSLSTPFLQILRIRLYNIGIGCAISHAILMIIARVR
jgi:hypothetical protein